MLSLGFSFENIVQLLCKSNTYYLVKIDLQGNYVYLNEHFTNRHSAYYDQESIKPANIALPLEDQALCYSVFHQCIENPDQCFPANVRKMDGKGGYIMTFWEYKANCSASGEVDSVVGVGYDITAFESHKTYIHFLTSTLNTVANQQSHLVRRPLANILGLVEVLDQFDEADGSLKDIVAMLRQSCSELNEEFDAFLIRDFSNHDNKSSV